MALPLSVLDLVPLGQDVTSGQALLAAQSLARHVDQLGYTRLWYAEHHNMPGITTTTPEILIAHMAGQTTRIRLGAGGVMLPNHAPLKVAESYRLLSALYPNRIDLGLGRAPGTDPLTALALRRSRVALTSDDFPEQLAELRGFGGPPGLPENHAFAKIRAMPDDVVLPPIWLLGSSSYSARLAAELGLGFAFAGHFSPDAPEGPLLTYRQQFRPGALNAPHAILALAVFCAETEADAARLASSVLVSFAELRTGRPARLKPPAEALAHIFSHDEEVALRFFRRKLLIGTPSQLRSRMEAYVTSCQADEIMVATHAFDPVQREHSYSLLAEVFRDA